MKKTFAWLLIFAMVLAMTACSNTASTTMTTTMTTTTATTMATVETVTTTVVANEANTKEKLTTKATEKATTAAKNEAKGTTQATTKASTQASTKPAVHQHSYKEEIVQKASCVSTGTKKLTCSCGDTRTETIPVTSHTWIAATCDTPKTCEVCKAQEGQALGHSTTLGKCSRCNQWEISGMGHVISLLNQEIATDENILSALDISSSYSDEQNIAAVRNAQNCCSINYDAICSLCSSAISESPEFAEAYQHFLNAKYYASQYPSGEVNSSNYLTKSAEILRIHGYVVTEMLDGTKAAKAVLESIPR